ncbi:MAG: hypothetical protein NZO58_12520 [Gemmataceae bacterium]|nr:hypothetical protein [Gemmataceae bacterium]
MRSRILMMGIASAVGAALLAAGATTAQGQDKKGPPAEKKGKAFERPEGKSSVQMVERILSFDANKDGSLDREELRRLIETLSAPPVGDGLQRKPPQPKGDEPQRKGPPFGRRPDGDRPEFPLPELKGAKGPFVPKMGVEVKRLIAEMELPKEARERAERMIQAHQEKVRGLVARAHEELLGQLKEVLSPEQHRTFKEALERFAGPPGFAPGPGFVPFPGKDPGRRPEGGPVPPDVLRPSDLERRFEELRREVEELRQQLRKKQP